MRVNLHRRVSNHTWFLCFEHGKWDQPPRCDGLRPLCQSPSQSSFHTPVASDVFINILTTEQASVKLSPHRLVERARERERERDREAVRAKKQAFQMRVRLKLNVRQSCASISRVWLGREKGGPCILKAWRSARHDPEREAGSAKRSSSFFTLFTSTPQNKAKNVGGFF